jgi:hypothetical protein
MEYKVDELVHTQNAATLQPLCGPVKHGAVIIFRAVVPAGT